MVTLAQTILDASATTDTRRSVRNRTAKSLVCPCAIVECTWTNMATPPGHKRARLSVFPSPMLVAMDSNEEITATFSGSTCDVKRHAHSQLEIVGSYFGLHH